MEHTAARPAFAVPPPAIPRAPALEPLTRGRSIAPPRPRRARVRAVVRTREPAPPCVHAPRPRTDEALRPRLLARAAYLGPVALHKVQSALELARSVDDNARAAHNLAVADLCAQLGMDCDTVCAAVLSGLAGAVGARAVEAAVGSAVLTVLEAYNAVEQMVSRAEDACFTEASYVNLRELVLLAARDEHRALSLRLAASAVAARALHHAVSEHAQHELLATRAMYLDAPLANQLGMWYLQSVLEESAFRHLYPREYDDVNKALAVRLRSCGDLLDIAKTEVESVLAHARGVRAAVSRSRVVGRVKGAYSVHRKMQRSGKSLAQIYDVLALRVIVAPKRGGGDAEECAACYAVADAIRQHYPVLESREKDYLVRPKSNGYRSLHLTILAGPAMQPLEVQIRSEKMHHVAEFGAAAHWLYKDGARFSRAECRTQGTNVAAAISANGVVTCGAPMGGGAHVGGVRLFDMSKRMDSVPYPRPRIPPSLGPAAEADAKRRTYVSHITDVIRQTRVIVKSCGQLYTLTVGSTLSDLLAGLGFASIGGVAFINGTVAPLTQRLEMNDIIRFSICAVPEL